MLLPATMLPASVQAQQKQPYLFDVALAEKPADVQSLIASYSQGLPGLPLSRMTETGLAGPVSLWHYHEAAQFLERLFEASQQDYSWPTDSVSCAAHGNFEMVEIAPDGASAQCLSARDSIAAAVAIRDACQAAAEPERYVLSYPPGVVNDGNTNSVLDLIGVMGSTFAELPPLYEGVLPAEFVPRLRDVLRKLRHDELMAPLDAQLSSFRQALESLQNDSECFLPEARLELESRVEQLVLEAAAQRDHMLALRLQGEVEVQREELRLGAISRSRHALAYPSLTQSDREFLAFWIGALYWRLRGGGIIALGGTQECRRLGLRRPFNVIGDLAGRADGMAAADGIYCEIFSGWGEWFDMGTTPGQEDKYYDLVMMTNRGYEQIRTAEAGTTLLNPCTIPDAPFVLDIVGLRQKGYDTKELFAGGLSMGPCYYYPWDRLLGWVWAADLQAPYLQVVDGPTAIGELCVGGSIALGLVRTLMYGWGLGSSPHIGKDAISIVEPMPADACVRTARATVIPLDAGGAPLPPGQDVSLVADPPYVEGGSIEPFTDPSTGVTEYRVEVESGRCFEDPRPIRIRVGGVELVDAPEVLFPCPPVADDGVAFAATPTEVLADGQSAAEVRITVTDLCGEPAFGRQMSLQILGDAPAALSTTSPITEDAPNDPLDGAAVLEARCSEPGAMGLRATVEGIVFDSDPDLVTFTAGASSDGGGDSGGGAPSGGERAADAASGCGCRVPSGRGAPPTGWLLLLLGLASRCVWKPRSSAPRFQGVPDPSRARAMRSHLAWQSVAMPRAVVNRLAPGDGRSKRWRPLGWFALATALGCAPASLGVATPELRQWVREEPVAPGHVACAVFDADGTLWDFDLSSTLVERTLAERRASDKGLPAFQALFAELGLPPVDDVYAATGTLSNAWSSGSLPAMAQRIGWTEEAIHLKIWPQYSWLYAGEPPAVVSDLARQLVDQGGYRPRLFAGARVLVGALRERGFRLAVVSGGVHEFVAAVAPELGFRVDEVRGLRVVVADGVLTTEVVPPVPYMSGKVEIARAMCGGPPMFAFGDSVASGDADLLAYSARPVAVKPHGRHLAAAEAKGLPIWEHPERE